MLFNGLVTTISQVAKGVIGFIKGSDQPAVVYHDTSKVELVEPVSLAIDIEKELEAKRAKQERERQERLVTIDSHKEQIVVDNIALKKACAKTMTLERWGKELIFVEREKLHTKCGIPDYLLDEGRLDGDLFWVPIPGYEGAYEISNFGTVRSLNRVIENAAGRRQRISGRDLKRITAGGELAYGLSKGGKQTVFNVARLVVAVFMANKINFSRSYKVIHIDGHNGNCHVNNLKVEYI